MSHIADWQRAGISPLQDHQEGVIHSRRLMPVGARIGNVPHPEDGTTSGVIEIAQDSGMGTIGDIHPWFFWQTSDRSARGMGSWAQSFAALTVGGATGGFKPGQTTGHNVRPSSVLPLRDGGYSTDWRYKEKFPGWPGCFSANPQGTAMVVMPGTLETGQHEVMMHADSRLIAANLEGPGECGTLVCDLQPEGEICMDGSKKPGEGGRHARLQSFWRVVSLPPDDPMSIDQNDGNAIAWNLSNSESDHTIGYGLCYAHVDSEPAPPIIKQGPTTGGPGTGTAQGPPQAAITGVRSTNAGPRGPLGTPPPPAPPGPGFVGGGGAGGGGNSRGVGLGPVPATSDPSLQQGGGEPAQASGGSSACSFGKFLPKKRKAHGLMFMAQHPTSGPFTAGHEVDKHIMGFDADGHTIASGHLDVNAYFYRNLVDDGPLFFEGRYPTTEKLPLKTRVHLTFDPVPEHPWFDVGARGYWKWWSEATKVVPGETTVAVKTGPIVKKGPITGTPSEPGFLGGGGFTWTDVGASNIGRVGEVSSSSISLFETLSPMQEGFVSISWRPELKVKGKSSFIHNRGLDADEAQCDEASRPQTIVGTAWGAQNASGEWDYTQRPDVSRARGGTANGGVLFHPPRYLMEDYFAINSAVDVTVAGQVGFVCCAPGTGFAMGLPNTSGGLKDNSAVLRVDPADVSQIELSQYVSGTLTQVLTVDAAVPTFEVALNMGNNKIVNMASATVSGDAVPLGQVVADFMPFIGGTFVGAVTMSSGDLTFEDDIIAVFGTGGDAYISYDGTNLLIRPKVIGSGEVNIDGIVNISVDFTAMRWGAGADAEIYFDGTDMILDPDRTSTGKLKVLGVVNSVGGFSDNGTAGIDASIEFTDHDSSVHTVTVSGGLITQWDTA